MDPEMSLYHRGTPLHPYQISPGHTNMIGPIVRYLFRFCANSILY